MPIVAKEKRNQLMHDGFCTFEDVLSSEMVAKLNAMSEWMIGQQDEEHFEQHRSQGCIIPYWTCPHPTFTELLIDPGAMAVFTELGFDAPKFWSGFVISKPPHSPPLYWHQDGVLWEHPISYTNQPAAVFFDVLFGRYEYTQRLFTFDSRLSPETSPAARYATEGRRHRNPCNRYESSRLPAN